MDKQKKIYRNVVLIWIPFFALMSSGCGEPDPLNKATLLPYYNEASFTPNWFDSRSEVHNDFHKIPAFKLLDQDGLTITEQTFENKLYIANFFFAACPGICPMTMGNMARLQKAFAEDDDVLLISHSVTPEKDSLAALQAFAEKMRVLSSKWHMVTGDRDQIYSLGKNFYFAEEDLGEIEQSTVRDQAFLHTESFFLVDQDRHIRGVYNGMNTASVTQLIADVRALQKEDVLD